VPGGGPFADQVRALQKRRRFDDGAAHHMALLGMEQYGRMLAALQPGLQPAASRADIVRARRAGRAAVWMPTRMVLADPAIAASWNITSDSLAAWLAGKLGATRLVLVKSVALADGSATASDLARRGIVDPAFPDYFARSGAEGWCIDDAGYGEMADALKGVRGPGAQIVAKRAAPRRLPLRSGMLTSRPDRPRTPPQ
jgi:5-(aminomethyl)-3-furanmethanol phosphate kinase